MISRKFVFGIALAVTLAGFSRAAAQEDPATPGKRAEQPGEDADQEAAREEAAREEAAREDAAREQEYHKIVKQAVYETGLGNWEEARALFKQAHALRPSARTFRGLGMAAFNMRDYVQAIRDLRTSLTDERRRLTDSQRAHVNDLLQRAGKFVGQFRLDLDPEDATVLLNGNPLVYESDGTILVNLGQHSLRAKAPAHRELTRKLKVEGGEERVLKLSLEPLPDREASPAKTGLAAGLQPAGEGSEPAGSGTGGRLWTWVALGAAVASGGSAVYFGLRGDDEYDKLEEQCKQNPCLPGDVDASPVETNHTAANVLYAVSGACLAGAVVLFFVEAGDSREEGEAALSVAPGNINVKGRF